MGFPRQEYWSRLPFLPPGDLPNPGIEPRSPALQVESLPTEPSGMHHVCRKFFANRRKADGAPLAAMPHEQGVPRFPGEPGDGKDTQELSALQVLFNLPERPEAQLPVRGLQGAGRARGVALGDRKSVV